MSVVEQETAVVYRGGGRRYFTRLAAIRGYASAAYRRKHACECEQMDYASGYPGFTCGACMVRDKVLARYMAWLIRADKAQRRSQP